MSLLTSIHEIGVALQAYLTLKKCPLPVIDGPEAPTTTWGRERIVIEHDTSARGSYGPPRGLHTNSDHRFTSLDPYKVTIYAKSGATGAQTFEHRSRAKLVAEIVVAGLEYVKATNKNPFELKDSGFITPPDLAASEQPGGAVFEIKFVYGLPVRAVTFAGDARPEGTLTGMTSSTVVGRAGIADTDNNPNTPQAGAETACGA